MTPRSYAIIGTGALGGYYGSLLHRAGFATSFLAPGDAGQIKRRGLIIESPQGMIEVLNPQVFARPADLPPGDVAVVCLKTTRNHLLPDILPCVLKPGGTVLLLQNGLGIEREALQAVAADQILVGVCHVCCERTEPGRIRHIEGGRIVLGQFTADGSPGVVTPRVRDVGGDFKTTGIAVHPIDDLLRAQWQKLLWNIPFNGLSVVLDAKPHELAADPQARARIQTIMREVIEAAQSIGRDIPESRIGAMIEQTRALPPFRTSLRMDYERVRPMELQTMYVNPMQMAADHGARMPATAELLETLQSMESRSISGG